MFSMPTPASWIVWSSLWISLSTQQNPKVDGNCISGRIFFNPQRVLNVPAEFANNPVDAQRFDMTIDYGAGNVLVLLDILKNYQ